MSIIRIDEEIRNLIPRMSHEEYLSLKDSIKKHGRVLEPVVVWNGIVLDGCYRFEIATELGLPYETREISLPDKDAAIRYRVETALVRRHLNTYERIMLAEDYRDLFEKEAKEAQGNRNDLKQKAKNLRESKKPPSEDGDPVGFDDDDEEDVEKAYGEDDASLYKEGTQTAEKEKRKQRRRNETGYRLAKLAGTNETSYRQALWIKASRNTEIINAVRAGEMTINKAYTTLKASTADITNDLVRHKASVAKAMLQLQESYGWLLSQYYEQDGENVTELIRESFQKCICDNQNLINSLDAFHMISGTGIISLGTEENTTEQENAA